MQFILESQAKAEIRMQKFESRMEKSETRVNAMEMRLDKRMDGITKILHHGLRMLVRIETKVGELAEAQKELAEAQKQTDRSLKALIKSLHNGRNGRL
jgi:hypothetical protein